MPSFWLYRQYFTSYIISLQFSGFMVFYWQYFGKRRNIVDKCVFCYSLLTLLIIQVYSYLIPNNYGLSLLLNPLKYQLTTPMSRLETFYVFKFFKGERYFILITFFSSFLSCLLSLLF